MGTNPSGRADQSPTEGLKAAHPPRAGELEDLRAEFPGWTIQAGTSWRAVRDGGHSGPLEIAAPSYGALRALLDECDAVDCRHATIALAEALHARGLVAEVYGLTVVTQTRAGIQRTVGARRGRYTWATGVDLAPIGDPDAVAALMLPGLGLA